MVNEKILEEINNNKIMLDNYEIASVKEDYFENIIKEIKRTKAPYVGKTLLRETDKKLSLIHI